MPLSVGGDHSITLPVLRSIVGDDPVGLVNFDAHTDSWDEELGSRFSHGTPFRRAVEEEIVDPKRTNDEDQGWIEYCLSLTIRVVSGVQSRKQAVSED